jgi:Uma2 family endonuclease
MSCQERASDHVSTRRGGRFREKSALYNRAMPVVYETETPLAPRTGLGPYRGADYFALPDEPRCELLYGRLLVTPAPVVRHQSVVARILHLLLDLADSSGGFAVASPVDVVLADHSVVQPDVIFVAAARRSIVGDRVIGAPDLVVEVLSPGTARRDVGEKLRLYAEAGVPEYWIVDPVLGTFEFLEKTGDDYRVRLPEGVIYRSAVIAGLELDLEAFWRAIPS